MYFTMRIYTVDSLIFVVFVEGKIYELAIFYMEGNYYSHELWTLQMCQFFF